MGKQTKTAAVFTKVSEWTNNGGMSTGFFCLENVERQTERAIGFKAEKYNTCGNLGPAICWMPRSKINEVENDFYLNGPAKMFLVPAWLYNAKAEEGFIL